MIGIGLNWWQAIIVIFVSQFISSFHFVNRDGIQLARGDCLSYWLSRRCEDRLWVFRELLLRRGQSCPGYYLVWCAEYVISESV